MTERWQRTVVIGRGAEDRYTKETILHRRGDDVLGMAMRRNPQMAGCEKFEMETEEAFALERDRDEERRRKKDIPRDQIRGEEWDW